MSAQDNGGPAFPVREGMLEKTQTGMSLRDYFAAKAMHAAITSEDALSIFGQRAKANGLDPVDLVAHSSYAMADAMLKARAQ